MKPPRKNATASPMLPDTPTIPANIQSIKSLYWHKRHMPLNQPPEIFPCYIVSRPPRRGRGTGTGAVTGNNAWDSSSSDDSDSDSDEEDEEVTIEYLSAYETFVKRQTVMPKRLIPFYGVGPTKGRVVLHNANGDQDDDYDDEELSRLTWSESHMQEYFKQRRQKKNKNSMDLQSIPFLERMALGGDGGSDFDEEVERRYLQQVLRVVKQREGGFDGGTNYNDEDHDDVVDEDDLEEPYTQAAVRTKKYSSDLDDDGDERSSCSSSSSSSSTNSYDLKRLQFRSKKPMEEKSNEPIRPGDVIEYYSPMFVFGSKQGKRIATVQSVNPNRNMVLKLSNHEYLPNDTKIKRIKILVTVQADEEDDTPTTQHKKILLDHPGVFRRIRQFQLRKLKWPADYKIQTETETDRLKSVLDKNMSTFKKKVEKIGFAPMEFLHRYGKKGGGRQECVDQNNGMLGDGNSSSSSSSSDDDDTQTNQIINTKRSMENNDKSHCSDSDDDSDGILRKILNNTPKKQKKMNPVASLGGNVPEGSLLDSDNDDSASMDCDDIKPEALENENQLKLLGLSDDELPQSVFDIQTTHSKTIHKGNKMTTHQENVASKVVANNQQCQDLVVAMSDSESTSDSMNFHSSLSPTNDMDKASIGKSAQTDDKRTKYQSLVDDEVSSSSSSTFSDSSDDDSVQIIVKKKNKSANDNIVVSNNASRIKCMKKIGKENGCEKKRISKHFSNPIIPKSSLSISFRKYN